jgi:LysM repeat protein
MLKKTLLILSIALLFLNSCKSSYYKRNNKQIEKKAIKDSSNIVSYTTLSYIEAFKAAAIEEMKDHGIPASITLAQGILESGAGNSDLAKFANNHFGIKCTTEWKGEGYFKDDDKVNDCFRVYKDARESYRDHSVFLKRKRYSFLFDLDQKDYKNWALGLKTAGYATNPKYPELLIGVIEKYKLYEYDLPGTEREMIALIDKSLPQENITKAQKANELPTETSNYYTVKQGDTLFKISQLFKISVDEIKAVNNLIDNNLKIGQKLIVVK